MKEKKSLGLGLDVKLDVKGSRSVPAYGHHDYSIKSSVMWTRMAGHARIDQ